MEFIIGQHGNIIRLSIFIGFILGMILVEALFPKKKRTQHRSPRWMTNFGLSIVSTIVMRVLFPMTAITFSIYLSTKGWGLLNITPFPLWVTITLSVILLDLCIYAQHIAFHKTPYLWRLHKVHHADRDIDASTAIRFHPLEIIISMVFKFVVILILGPHAIGVFIFEIVLNAAALFNHANIALSKRADSFIRIVLVTPDMHRVHHSILPHETNSNYGFNLSIWDRLFKTYIAQPKHGHDNMVIGLKEYQTQAPSKILWCLTLPFQAKPVRLNPKSRNEVPYKD